ncbi:methyl-coenzyme M reductase-associated protein Mmp3 [Methanobrevibacter curvatus]|uniref:UPF0288 protein MBCUR_05730 n=1 Tax=Methanobrevibacter curvatus TaxID=49547 RepID=A0A166CBW3_9EURY|nr:methanogenesis marker 3 protein [Methanobrevibacter curvatus]KZX14349.1 hypothetical protein MBCUR_05730 [Methanobrevibacter curvatus]
MLIKINGEDFEIEDGSTIAEAIDLANAPYNEGCILSLIKGKKEFEENINKYKIKTSKGSIIIALLENKNLSDAVETFKSNYNEFSNSHIRWTTSNEMAVGPIVSKLKPSTEEYTFKQWDVILSLSGFSADSTHILMFKEDTTGIYGVPQNTNGVFAHVIGGKRTLKLLEDSDEIYSIEPIVERSSVLDTASISDLDTILNDGNELFTYVLVEPNSNSPQSVEHLFSLIDDDTLSVDYDSNSFLGFYKLHGLKKIPEEVTARKRGTITLRNDGVGIGRVYFYREDRVISNAHTAIGHVKKGMELIDMAKKGDLITIKSNPDRILTLDLTQSEASKFLDSKNILHEKDGLLDDDAVVVIQDPAFTMDIIKEGKVKTFGINKNDLALIKLESNAPRSILYFKKLSNLIERPIGQLKVFFAYEGISTIFEKKDSESKGLVPENTPENHVDAGVLALTNMSRKNLGLIGVRFEDSDTYGPTGEPFTGTNIIGKITTDLDVIKKLKSNDILYIKEDKN